MHVFVLSLQPHIIYLHVLTIPDMITSVAVHPDGIHFCSADSLGQVFTPKHRRIFYWLIVKFALIADRSPEHLMLLRSFRW